MVIYSREPILMSSAVLFHCFISRKLFRGKLVIDELFVENLFVWVVMINVTTNYDTRLLQLLCCKVQRFDWNVLGRELGCLRTDKRNHKKRVVTGFM